MSGAGNTTEEKWTVGTRFIPGAVPRASFRATMSYRLHPRLTAGIEVNPRAEDSAGKVSPLLNWLMVSESNTRPAIIVGTSSDRIGTPKGQSFYATLSKSLKPATGLPLAPYVGVAYGTYEHRWRPIGGLNIYLGRRFSSTIVFDGVRLHGLVNYSQGRHVVSFVLAYFNKPGLSYSVSF